MTQDQIFPETIATTNHKADITPTRTRSRHDYVKIKKGRGEGSENENAIMVTQEVGLHYSVKVVKRS